MTPFLEHNVPNLWVYYCCGQGYKVSNRFFGMPSARNRIIGTQFYKYNVAGFLQWGFNFYNAQLSMYHIDPFAVTDADGAFPSGDAFVVYPGPDGTPWKSLRLLTFNEALNDLRAFRLLESFTSREFVMDLLEAMLSGRNHLLRLSAGCSVSSEPAPAGQSGNQSPLEIRTAQKAGWEALSGFFFLKKYAILKEREGETMVLVILPVLVLALYGAKFTGKGIRPDYISRESTQAVKGHFRPAGLPAAL